jgi:hypothetical protein
MFLSENEIENLTGYKLAKCQIRWLRNNGINCLVSYDGKPKVLASHLEEVMGKTMSRKSRRVEPDFSALTRLQHVA